VQYFTIIQGFSWQEFFSAKCLLNNQ